MEKCKVQVHVSHDKERIDIVNGRSNYFWGQTKGVLINKDISIWCWKRILEWYEIGIEKILLYILYRAIVDNSLKIEIIDQKGLECSFHNLSIIYWLRVSFLWVEVIPTNDNNLIEKLMLLGCKVHLFSQYGHLLAVIIIILHQAYQLV